MKSSIRTIVFYLAPYLILVLIISWLGLLFFPASYIFSPTLPAALSNWDGGYYLLISQTGFKDPQHFAFLPLYPLLIYFFNLITQNPLISGLVISWGSFFIALAFLFELIKKEFSIKIAQQSLIYLLLFPTSFYLVATYTESLFLMLVVLTFYFLQRQNKYDLIFATITVSLALVTRVFGLGLLLALWAAVLLNEQLKYRWVALLAPIILIAYIYYLQINYHDPLLILSAQTNWSREIDLTNFNLFSILDNLWSKPLTDKVIIQWLEYIFMAFGLGMLIRVMKYQKLPYALYSLTIMLIILISGNLMSVPRYLLIIFPIFIALATWKKNHSINLPWNKIYLVISTGLLLIFLTRFINGYWVS